MGTPFISFLEPSKLEGYSRSKLRDEQAPSIPRTFLDAMEVRHEVFVQEQNVPLENEFDSNDPRCCHWVAYASVNKLQHPEVRDEHGALIQPRKSSTKSTPIGTLRVVPFPHDPHPVPGGKYWDGVLQDEKEQKSSSPSAEMNNSTAAVKPFITDRPTVFHDGKEPYVKLGRMAVIKDFRGHRIAGQLVAAALSWLRENPEYFDLSVKELGLENIGAVGESGEVPSSWKGLVCVHAQVSVKSVWARWGFQEDEAMGIWEEEGIQHVGMFQRLEIKPKTNVIT